MAIRMTEDQLLAAFPGRKPAMMEALRLHLVHGESITEAIRKSGASRSGIYKALGSQVDAAQSTPALETWVVACPSKHAPVLRERIAKQLAIWEQEDVRNAALQAQIAGHGGVPYVGTNPPAAPAVVRMPTGELYDQYGNPLIP